MDKSIDDQLIRDAREDGASRERIRIRGLLQEEYAYWLHCEHDAPSDFGILSGATGALANVLCRIDGLLPRREVSDG